MGNNKLLSCPSLLVFIGRFHALTNVSESAFAGSGDVKNTSLNTVANNSSAIIEEGSIIMTNSDTGIVKQETSMSEPAPVRHPGQPPREVVFALPLRDDGKIWSGRATFTASKPIEVEVLHITIHGKI